MKNLALVQNRPLRILLTNDDGFHADGLKVLKNIAQNLSSDIWTVAPAHNQSGVGHALTYREPLRLKHHGPKSFSVNGTPADCMILALEKVMKETPPDLVLSGVNSGENLGESITSSGTVAACIQATLSGVPAIALSQVTQEGKANWQVAENFGPQVIETLISSPWEKHTLININFPHCTPETVKGVRVVAHGKRTEASHMVECVDPRGRPYYWIGVLREEKNPTPETDLWMIRHNYIAVTPLQVNLSHYPSLTNLQKLFDSNDPHKKLWENKQVV